MKNTARTKRIALMAGFALTLSLVTPGCALIGEVLSLLGFDLLGVQPASNFSQTGNVSFALTGRTENGGVHQGQIGDEDIDVYVENEDGTYDECDFVNDQYIEDSQFNTIALVLDSSGSMERSYPEEEYGDLCLTCPHDPERVRIGAAYDLARVISEQVPASEMSVYAFGPDPSEGWLATQVLTDFTTDLDSLADGLAGVGGDELAGTPMWDSLAEIITATDDSADQFQDLLRRDFDARGTGNGTGDHGNNNGPIIIHGDNNTVNNNEGDNNTIENTSDNDTTTVEGDNNDVSVNDNDVTVQTDDSTDTTTDVDNTTNDIDVNGTGVDTTGGNSTIEDPYEGVEVAEDIVVQRYIVVVSDGQDLDSELYTLDDVIALANEYNVTIHAIGLGPASANFQSDLLRTEEQYAAVTSLQRLADETGGFYASAFDAEELNAMYQNVAASLTEGYNATTFTCDTDVAASTGVGGVPTTNNGGGRAIRSGDRVRGYIDSNGRRTPFTFIAP